MDAEAICMTKWRENLMKKSLLALMLAVALVSLTACGSKVKRAGSDGDAGCDRSADRRNRRKRRRLSRRKRRRLCRPKRRRLCRPKRRRLCRPESADGCRPKRRPLTDGCAVVVEATAMRPRRLEADAQSDEAAAAVVISETTEAPADEEAARTLSDDVLASAYNGAVTVLKSEIQDEYDQMLSQYVAYYAQYGYSVDEYDTELQASVAQETVQTKLSTSIVRHYAAENGYELTEEKEGRIGRAGETALDNTREYLESYLSASGFTGDELNAAVRSRWRRPVIPRRP